MIIEYKDKELLTEGVENILPCDIAPLNEALDGGFRTGDLVVLQAPSGEGKSTFLMRMAIKAINRKRKILYMSCGEQSGEEILIRLLCMYNRVQYNGTHTDGYSAEEIKGFEESKAKFAPFLTVSYVEDGMSYKDIEEAYKNGTDVVVIDYLGACLPPEKETAYAFLTRMASRLKRIANEKNILIITAMQTVRGLNRELAEEDVDLSTIDESFMADSIGPARKATIGLSMFTYQNNKYIIIYKNRFNGNLCVAKIKVEPKSYQMRSVDPWD